MKRLNHLVLWSITVLASVGLAGLFIFPASWAEQTYDCDLDRGICSPVEDWNWAYTCTDGWDEWIRCTWPQQLNFCTTEGWNWEDIFCEDSFTRSKTSWWYYFTRNVQNFSWDSYCELPVAAEPKGLNTQTESMITCDYYWNPAVHYDSCINDDGSIFCSTKYVSTQDGGVLVFHEDPTAESGYAYCEVMSVFNNFGNREFDSQCYDPNSEFEVDCLYNDGDFTCPIEYACIEWPGGEYCHIYTYDPEWEDEWWYYCASNNLFSPAVDNVNDKNNSCLPINEWTGYNNCKYINGMGYFCPIQQSCELDTDWYYCDSETWWEYTCYPNINILEYNPDLDQTVAAVETIEPIEAITSYSCEKVWEEPITNCQVKEREDSELHSTSELVVPDFYLFCPVEIKYECDSEDWLAVVCNPSTTGNFSCELPIPQNVHTVDYIQDGNVVCGDEHLEYDNCYEEWSKYICPIPQKCDLEAWGYYCSSNRSATDYYYCKFKQLIFDSVNLNQSDSFCERQTEDRRTLPDCYNDGFWEIYCPIKYNCTLQNGMYECSQTNAENEYFYCTSKFHEWVVKASETYMEYDYYCFQPNVGWKQHNDCAYDDDSGKFMCLPDYKCDHKAWGYQCDIYDWGEYRCKLPSPVLAAWSMLNYVCSGPNTYNNCYPNGGWYFCPEEESTTVTLDLYMWGCIPSGGPTAAAAASEYYCDGNGYLRSVTVNINAWVNPKYLTNEVKEKLPNLEEWMEWVWYLENDHNGNKLAESTTFAQNSSLYVFQDERKIGTISFNSDWGTDVPSVTWYYDTTITLPSPTKTGYTFAWWYDGNNKVSMSYTIVWDRTLIAHWTDSKPSWWYSGWGGSSSRPSSKWSWPSTSEVKSTENEPTTPAKEVKAEPKPVVPWKWANYTGKVNPNQELFDAYEWAYANGLTKYSNMSDARMDDLLNRQEMAKISTIFATKFQWETPNEKKRDDCSQYPDLWKTTKDMQEFIIQSCELGYMWYRANGIDYLERFRPYTPVSVAEVSIILSRIMWQNKYAISENLWYQWHLHAVYENNLLDNISKPFDYIARKDAYIMLYRISKSL